MIINISIAWATNPCITKCYFTLEDLKYSYLYIMANEQLKRLERLVNSGFFNKSVEDFGPNHFLFENDASLIPKRFYFIKVRQPPKPGIDTIVMFEETKDNIMHFKQYYFRKRRLGGTYNIFQKTDIDIKIPIESDLYIVDITDIIENESQINDVYTAMHIEREPDTIISKLPPSLGPEKHGILTSYLRSNKKGGKTRMKKTSKSTRKKRTKNRHHNKTKNKK